MGGKEPVLAMRHSKRLNLAPVLRFSLSPNSFSLASRNFSKTCNLNSLLPKNKLLTASFPKRHFSLRVAVVRNSKITNKTASATTKINKNAPTQFYRSFWRRFFKKGKKEEQPKVRRYVFLYDLQSRLHFPVLLRYQKYISQYVKPKQYSRFWKFAREFYEETFPRLSKLTPTGTLFSIFVAAGSFLFVSWLFSLITPFIIYFFCWSEGVESTEAIMKYFENVLAIVDLCKPITDDLGTPLRFDESLMQMEQLGGSVLVMSVPVTGPKGRAILMIPALLSRYMSVKKLIWRLEGQQEFKQAGLLFAPDCLWVTDRVKDSKKELATRSSWAD